MLEHYDCDFNQEEGDIYRLKRVAIVCQMFNLFVLKVWDLASLELLIDDLVYFEHKCFTDFFSQNEKGGKASSQARKLRL